MFNKILIATIALTAAFFAADSARAAEVDAELQCLAKNIYFEARNQPLDGQLAVAQVTLNRVKSHRYPDSICGVVQQGQKRSGQMVRNRCQFSWYCDGRSDRPRNIRAFNQAMRVAKQVLYEDLHLPELSDATHYHTNYVSPSWSRKLVRVASVGDHIFYINKRRR